MSDLNMGGERAEGWERNCFPITMKAGRRNANGKIGRGRIFSAFAGSPLARPPWQAKLPSHPHPPVPLTPEIQQWLALAAVAATILAFAWRSARARRRKPGCGGSCGCPKSRG
jgi:hypothetical protein